MKKKVLIYSDCFIFGGCENVLVNLLASPRLNERFELKFAYARNRDYEAGVERALPSLAHRQPLRILSDYNLFYRLDLSGLNRLLVLLCKIPFKAVRELGGYDLYNFVRLVLFFRKARPDLIYINNGGYPATRSCLVAVFSARAAGVPSILLNVNNLAQPRRTPLGKLLDLGVDCCVDRFVTASRAAGLRLAELREFDAEKIANIPNTLRGEPSRGADAACLRTELGISSAVPVVGAVGLLTWRKGFSVLVEAVELLERQGYREDFRVVIFGEGEQRGALERQIAASGLGGRVVLAGFRPNVLDYVADFDLFVLPSLDNEDFPYAVVEAMALKKPVIGSRVAGIPEQIEDGRTGCVVPPGDAATLSRVILDLLEHPEKARAMGEAGYRKYQEEYRYDRVMALYERLFESLHAEERT